VIILSECCDNYAVSGTEALRGGAEMGVYSRLLRNGLQVYNRENMPVYQNGRGRLLYQAITTYLMPPVWVTLHVSDFLGDWLMLYARFL